MLKRSVPESLVRKAALVFALISLAGIFLVSLVKLSEMGL